MKENADKSADMKRILIVLEMMKKPTVILREATSLFEFFFSSLAVGKSARKPPKHVTIGINGYIHISCVLSTCFSAVYAGHFARQKYETRENKNFHFTDAWLRLGRSQCPNISVSSSDYLCFNTHDCWPPLLSPVRPSARPSVMKIVKNSLQAHRAPDLVFFSHSVWNPSL